MMVCDFPTFFRALWDYDPFPWQTMLAERAVDVVLTDVRMRGIDGIDLCSRLTRHRPDLPVVVMTGFGSIDTAVSAMRAGASDFLTKPIDLELLAMTLERAIAHAPRRSNGHNGHDSAARTSYGELVGASHSMRAVYEMVERAAPSDASVLEAYPWFSRMLTSSGPGPTPAISVFQTILPRSRSRATTCRLSRSGEPVAASEVA